MEPNALGAVIFALIVGVIVGALFHRWLTTRAQEVQATVAKVTEDASKKVNGVLKDL